MFDKYHKIPAQQKNNLPAGVYAVQEKIDGANAGVQLVEAESGPMLVVHSRNEVKAHVTATHDGPLTHVNVQAMSSDMAGFGGFAAWIGSRFEEVVQFMRDERVTHVYGEWLIPHTVKYPKTMYHCFYVFDLVVDGAFVSPVAYQQSLTELGWFTVREVKVTFAAQPGASELRAVSERLRDEAGRQIEGTVFKRYDLDKAGTLDRFGQRFCYKDVLPSFIEAKVEASDKDARAHQSVEEQLVAAVPDTALEQVYLKVTGGAQGVWDNRMYPQYLGRMWQELLEEHLAGALGRLKMPVVNTRELKALMDRRSRTYVQEREVVMRAEGRAA